MSRQQHIGCAWGAHLLIAICCGYVVMVVYPSGRVMGVAILAAVAVLELVFVICMRFWMGRGWVWVFGYVCWFGLLFLSVIPWVMMTMGTIPKDWVEMGITLTMLPFLMFLSAVPVAGVLHWNMLQVGRGDTR